MDVICNSNESKKATIGWSNLMFMGPWIVNLC